MCRGETDQRQAGAPGMRRRPPTGWRRRACSVLARRGARAPGCGHWAQWAGGHVTGAAARSCARALVHHVSRRRSPRRSGGRMSCHVRAMRARASSCAVAWLAVTVADVRGVGAHMAPRACELASRPARGRDPVKHSCAARGRLRRRSRKHPCWRCARVLCQRHSLLS